MRDTEAKCKRILQVAEALFGDQGVERTTLKQVGKAAGVAVGSITHFFGKKPQLAAAVLDELVGRLANDAARALEGEERTVAEDVRALLSACLAWPATFPHHRRLIGRLEAYVQTHGQGQSTRLQDALEKVLGRWRDKRGGKGIAPLPPVQLYAVILAPALCVGMPTTQVAANGERAAPWLDVLTAAATAAITPPKAKRRRSTR